MSKNHQTYLIMPEEAKYDVFISYASKDYLDDQDKVIPDNPITVLQNYLHDNGISYWIDQDNIYPGHKFPEKLEQAIDESIILVFVSSANSNDSEWTPDEIIYARNNKKKVLPFRIDDSEYGKGLSLCFSRVEYCKYFDDHQKAMEQLLRGIEDAKGEYIKKCEREKIKVNLNQQEKEYDILISRIKPVADKIAELKIAMGNTARTCPVCGNAVPIKEYFCGTCGWTFVPPFKVSEEIDEQHLSKAKDVWVASEGSTATIKELEDSLAALKSQAEKDGAELSSLHGQMCQKDEALACVNKELSSLKQRFEEEKTGRKKAEDELQRLDAERKAWEEEKKEQAAFNGHEYVDLGLPSGLLWATCNVGAKNNRPADYGDYFAWGETAPKKSYTGKTLTYHENKEQLDLSHDAARANWGGNWRMPTHDDWVELYENCGRDWKTLDGVNGWLFTSISNRRSIFLPAAGWYYGKDLAGSGSGGFYWSSSLYPDGSDYAFGCYFNSGDVYPSGWGGRYCGRSVRPVASPSPSRK